MATVTIGKTYFESLLKKAEFHSSEPDFGFSTSRLNHVTIPKIEHENLLQASKEYDLLKQALFRGGLTHETLETLLEGEFSASNAPAQDNTRRLAPSGQPSTLSTDSSPSLGNTETSKEGPRARPYTSQRVVSYETQSSTEESPEDVEDENQDDTFPQYIPLHDQRTIHIRNLPERTTHKDLVEIIRGGRLLDIYIRTDRTATVSFVEGAAEFLAYTKRNDIYLHTRRLEFRWGDRQFRVPSHISHKITKSGATRNLVLRGVAGKVSEDEIRGHLDHIHNLVVISIYFKNGDAYVSTNSIHNAQYARTCMLSRSVYKGVQIDYFDDECAAPTPRSIPRARHSDVPTSMAHMSITNQYAVLDTDTEDGSDEDQAGMRQRSRADGCRWANAATA
ncbi:hypothetical protein IQ07DRAFT_600395 [Pyrenochaeta sp. DS3sAY3a]|nr:hypothetical protein IQ07DRAFT_600395 [Pyrenochaeta sp. DS3sAY3a]